MPNIKTLQVQLLDILKFFFLLKKLLILSVDDPAYIYILEDIKTLALIYHIFNLLSLTFSFCHRIKNTNSFMHLIYIHARILYVNV